ncbi:MAG: hypothetical protein U0790_13380 [Isosphaeraceae bacterium]
MARIFLADPSLISYSGHCYEYLASLAVPLRDRGDEVVILGNQAVDAALRDEHGVVPAFRLWCDTRFGTDGRTRRIHERAILDDLLRVSQEFRIDDRDLLVINTLRHWPLRGVVDWQEALPAWSRPGTALILHFTAFPDPTTSIGWERHYGEAFARIEASPCRDNFILMADSEELVAEFSLINPCLRFLLAPIPHARVHGGERDTLDRLRSGRKPRVGYVGEARANKGFDLLPRLLARAEEREMARSFELHVHAHCGDPLAPFYRRTMSGLRHPSVTLYHETMDDRQYGEFMAGLDIVALPYTTDNYHSQTSGVFSEAMGSGKIVVVPKGTWLSTQLGRYLGGMSFSPLDCEDFSDAVLEIVRDPLPHAVAAAERATLWRQFHNPDRLIGLLEGTRSRYSKAI